MNAETIALAALILVYLPAWVIGAVSQTLMIRFFRSRFPEIASTVYPSWGNKSINSDLQGFKYMLRREYATIPDSGFVARMDLHRMISLVALTVLLIGLVCGIVYFSLR